MNKIKEIIDTYPWLLMVLPIVIVVVIAFFFMFGKNNTLHPTPTLSINTAQKSSSTVAENLHSSSSNSTGSSYNLFTFLVRLFGGNTNSSTQNTTSNSDSYTTQSSQQQNIGNTSSQIPNPNSTIDLTPTSIENSSQNTQVSQNSPNTITSTPVVQIIFKTPDGGTQVYIPPATPPTDITWGRYVNTIDRYSIDYPTNWQVIKTEYNGHEGISLYLPGTNPSDPNVQYIGFGLATYYLLPAGNSQESTYSYPITISGINGTMYTQGVLGSGSMALVVQYAQGSFGMGSSVSDPDFIYVYNHMLQSLTFGPQ